MTRAEVLAYARTLEFIPPCLHWGTCQACGVTVWWADAEGNHSVPMAFVRHRCDVGPQPAGRMLGVVAPAGEYLFTRTERSDKTICEPTPALIHAFGKTWLEGESMGCNLASVWVEIHPGSDGTRVAVDTNAPDLDRLKWRGPLPPYDPVALSEAMRRDREP